MDQINSLNALVVDDNEVNAIILAKMINLFHIYTDQTFSGINAIKLYHKIRYDIVFIDHIMPGMNGDVVTKMIRSLEKDGHRAVIIILTACVTEELNKIYHTAGADDIIEKPLGTKQLLNILNKWFSNYPLDTSEDEENSVILSEEQIEIRRLLADVREINFDAGFKYAIGNPSQYIYILKSSLKDLKIFIDKCINGKEKTFDELGIAMHKIKNVLSNIGAIGLYEESKIMETKLSTGDINHIDKMLSSFVYHLREFWEKLVDALNEYDRTKHSLVVKEQMDYKVMSDKEYEQSILKAIYYIKRYEYDAIMNEIEKLIHVKDIALKKEFMRAMEEIKEFDYNSALIRISKLAEKNKSEAFIEGNTYRICGIDLKKRRSPVEGGG
ncbi:response regulator [Mobilitalea sibirica]|uniref:Stage 0 sporulation protein A homolog n=1 Tax=Mobilitalea sibirica TaxID=1462919 RepID=A0A8J7KZ75_9FIRM|nr:response regulator [Mobilitalea sibirica]MBH1939558.1 response regulator [Mobilitalea sibirica]